MKRLYVLILALILCFTSLNGCGTEETSAQMGKKTEVLLYDFEDYDRNFQLMNAMAYFGAVNVNKDEKYVKNGNISALIQPLGPHSTARSKSGWGLQQYTCLYIPFISEHYDFDYTDCAKIQTISMSIYNDEKTDINMYISLVFNKWVDELSEPVLFSLAPGWNEVNYMVDHNALAINHNLKSCHGIGLQFDKVNSRELKDAPKLYMDDIKLTVTEKAVQPAKVTLLDEDGTCSFESISQNYIVDYEVLDRIRETELDIVTAKDYGITATSGQKVLRAVLKPTMLKDGTVYEKIIIKQALMESFDLASAEGSDRICFDLYNGNDVAMDMAIVFEFPKATGLMSEHLYASPHQWTTFSICLDALTNDKLDYRTDVGQMEIHYGEFVGEERVIYIDNIRIEK